MSEFEEFIGKKFGKLIVVKYIGQSGFNSPLFECKCECGNKTSATSTQLRNGQKKSCGCLKKEHHYEYKKKIADLEAKLAEKKKESLKYFNEYRAWKSKCELLEQDQISFAVEQLTLFKNTIVNKMNNPYNLNIKHILSDFDNQIKQLKEMKCE